MSIRVVNPGEVGPIRIPIEFSMDHMKEILASPELQLDPEQVESECQVLLEHPEKRVSIDQVVAQVNAILGGSNEGVQCTIL